MKQKTPWWNVPITIADHMSRPGSSSRAFEARERVCDVNHNMLTGSALAAPLSPGSAIHRDPDSDAKDESQESSREEERPRLVAQELHLPVDAPHALEEGTMQRFLRWHAHLL